MRRYLHTLAFLLKAFVLGLAVMSLFRFVQYAVLHDMSSQSGAPVAPAFLRGLWFDNVIVCYVLVVPLAVLLFSAAFGYAPRWLRRASGIWISVFYVLIVAVSASNIPYFSYFFKNIDASIFGWMGYGATTAGMLVGERSYIIYFLLFAVVVGLVLWALRRFRRQADRRILQSSGRATWVGIAIRVVLSAALVGLCVFGIRGRMGYNPIKISQAYYCDDPFLNQLGISPSFNLVTSYLDTQRRENVELALLPNADAVAFARHELGLTGVADSAAVLRRHVAADSLSALSHAGTPPNVVIILMESMSASLMQTFGCRERLTPTLDSLYRCSLAFTHFYSAGIHTNHGLTATLCSFPALMMRNLMKGTVTPHRTSIATVLHQQGYRNLFFMTHESQYDNMNAFMRTNGYDEVYAQEDYPSDEVVNSFGVPDKYLFDYALPILRTAGEGHPFMATLLTISNHPPYIVPDWLPTSTHDPETQIVEYADWCIGHFLEQARHEAWYDNTIFVILADHGKLVGDMDAELPQSYNHIPCIIFGPGVAPALYDGLATQVDVMPTLLGLLGLDYDFDGFGVDLLRTRRSRVFYTSDSQIVARDSTSCLIHNPSAQRDVCYEVGADEQLRPTARTARHDSLRHYAFAMVQAAEFIYKSASRPPVEPH